MIPGRLESFFFSQVLINSYKFSRKTFRRRFINSFFSFVTEE